MIKIKLDQVLEARNITAYRLTKDLKLRPAAVNQMVNNEKLRAENKHVQLLNLDMFDRICTYLNCDLGDLLEYVPPEQEQSGEETTED